MDIIDCNFAAENAVGSTLPTRNLGAFVRHALRSRCATATHCRDSPTRFRHGWTFPSQGLTKYRCQSPGTPLSETTPRSSNSIPDPATRSLTVLETSTSLGPASAETLAPM